MRYLGSGRAVLRDAVQHPTADACGTSATDTAVGRAAARAAARRQQRRGAPRHAALTLQHTERVAASGAEATRRRHSSV